MLMQKQKHWFLHEIIAIWNATMLFFLYQLVFLTCHAIIKHNTRDMMCTMTEDSFYFASYLTAKAKHVVWCAI